jgi:predicted site-specific integrase-resolvase
VEAEEFMSTRKRNATAKIATNRMRVALYLRVSTDRQRQHDLSIPDQRAQILAWCDTNGHQAVPEFVEGGATGTDDKRPVFQRMIERACDGDNAFDVIAVHSYSRPFRNAFGQEFYLRKLAKQGVKLVSLTQPLGDDDDPAQKHELTLVVGAPQFIRLGGACRVGEDLIDGADPERFALAGSGSVSRSSGSSLAIPNRTAVMSVFI